MSSIAILCIVSWRIFRIAMLNRTNPHAEPGHAFTELEQCLLDVLAPDKPSTPRYRYIVKLARLSGFLARTHGLPPGNTVMWRELSRLTDIALGIMMGLKLCVFKGFARTRAISRPAREIYFLPSTHATRFLSESGCVLPLNFQL